jgi:hypothetical protein
MPANCVIWGTPATAGPATLNGLAWYDSPRAGGKYRINDWTSAKLESMRLDDRWKARLTTWLVNQHRAGVESPSITIDEVNAAQEVRPLRYADKIERFFLLLDHRSFNVGDDIELEAQLAPNHTLTDEIQAWCEFASHGEFIVSWSRKPGQVAKREFRP